jgi:hypothetical protein
MSFDRVSRPYYCKHGNVVAYMPCATCGDEIDKAREASDIETVERVLRIAGVFRSTDKTRDDV